jgi:hypothetical protein
LGNFTRQVVEARAGAIAETLITAFNQAEELRRRCAAELAAGTLDTAAFYGGTPADPTDKANVLGFLDDMHAVYQGMQGAVLPQVNYRRYLDFLTGT